MKPLILTNVAGEPRRVNPIAVLGWTATEHDIGNGRFLLGATVVLVAGPPVAVRETQEQIDWLFERATSARLAPTDLQTMRETAADLIAAGGEE